MAGDTIMPGVQCYYASNTLSTTNSSFNSVLSSLAMAILGTSTGAAEGSYPAYTSPTGTVYSGLSSFLSTKDQAPPTGYPKAYLNWILLDDQFNYVSSSSGSVATASSTYPAGQMNTVAPGGPVVMSRNGYLYVWVSNETQGWNVFFDNFSVQYKQGPVLEENHYYPFGLTMAGISDMAMKPKYAQNKYRYNSKELQNQEFSDGSGLEEYDYGARFQDPQLGIWHSVDHAAEKYIWSSPYSYTVDNPVRFIDPNGMVWEDPKDVARLRKKVVEELLSNVARQLADQRQLNDKDGNLTDDQRKSLQDDANETDEKIGQLNTSIGDIDKLGDDQHHTYRLGMITDPVSYSSKGKDGVITIWGGAHALDALHVHEIRHVSDALTAGKLGDHYFGGQGNKLSYDTYEEGLRETSAYKAQFAFSPESLGSLNSIIQVNPAFLVKFKKSNGNPLYNEVYEWWKTLTPAEKARYPHP